MRKAASITRRTTTEWSRPKAVPHRGWRGRALTVIEGFVALLEELERISHDHEELTDTDVRESIHLVLNHYFVWGFERKQTPCNFGMFSREGDALVSDAILRFLDAVDGSTDASAVPRGQARLDVLQAGGAKTKSGMMYDELIGHRETPLAPESLPPQLFSEGEYGSDDEE